MSVKRILGHIGITLLLMFVSTVSQAQRVKTVVLDAGHGGHDTGALGKNSREKDITLDIVLKLRDYIQQNIKDVKVILTRDSDVFVELFKRAKIANSNNADLFISIHCNSTKSSQPYGTETFVMGLHKSEANLSVAKAENSAILLEDNYVVEYDGFDPNSPEGNIFFAMMQNAFLDNSLEFAGKVQKQFAGPLNRFDRGVKQAGFLVLYKTAMPGVLIETGFLSNAEDEKYLLSEKGKSQIAAAIGKALKDYKASVEKIPVEAVTQIPEKPKTDTTKNLLQPADKPMADTKNQAAEKSSKWDDKSPPPGKNDLPPKSGILPVLKTDSAKTVTSSATSAATPVKSAPLKTDELVFKIQFLLSPKLLPTNSPEFKKVKNVEYYQQDGFYKYTSGQFSTLAEANAYRQTLVESGFKDAFVVPFIGSKRITVSEARKITGN